jgi:hypothetical protein
MIVARVMDAPAPWFRIVLEGVRAIPPWHFAIGAGLGLLWGVANALGWTLGHATTDVPLSAAHFVYESLLPMLLLVVGIGIADEAARGDANAVAPYAIAALSAAIAGEIVFTATIPWLGLAHCGCSMDRWSGSARTANMLPDSILICSFVTAGYRFWRRASLRLARLRGRELERAQITRRMLESRLQAMQAYIEPQFLFDTLGEVERLHGKDPKTAARLIDELIIYLRAALPHLRESTSTVAKETELAHAWLNIRRLRNGHGPAFTIDVRNGAEIATMAPMLVLPLVEYVLGDPADTRAGCTLQISARVAASRLRLAIAARGTSGLASPCAADKLAGLRERLSTLYGDDATLTIGHDDEHAVVLTLDLPHERQGAASR